MKSILLSFVVFFAILNLQARQEEALYSQFDDIQIEKNLSVFPNPVTGDSKVYYNNGDMSVCQVTIMNVLGNTVYDGLIESGRPNALPPLDKGVYFYVVSDKGEISTLRLLVSQ